MRLNFITRRLGGAPEFRDHARRRLAFALDRFRDQVRLVRVRLEDVNGPHRGGVDTRVVVEVVPHGAGSPVRVERLGVDALATFDRVAQRVARALARRRGRALATRRRRQPATIGGA